LLEVICNLVPIYGLHLVSAIHVGRAVWKHIAKKVFYFVFKAYSRSEEVNKSRCLLVKILIVRSPEQNLPRLPVCPAVVIVVYVAKLQINFSYAKLFLVFMQKKEGSRVRPPPH